MATQLRSTTNLVVPPELRLPRDQLKSGFLYVYNKGYKGLEPIFMQGMWLSAIFPEIFQDPNFGKNRASVREFATTAEKELKAGFLKLKKVNDPNDPHFVAAVPLMSFNPHSSNELANKMHRWFASPPKAKKKKGDKGVPGMEDDDLDTPIDVSTETNMQYQGGHMPSAAILNESLMSQQGQEGVQQKVILGRQVVEGMGLDGKAKSEMDKCLLAIRIQYVGSLAVIYADFKITKEEAQQLTTTEWMMIRNIDFYPLLLAWQVSLWGYRHKAPMASFPMSKISRTLPPVFDGDARVSEHNLSISPEGKAMWLPTKLDNTQRYEDLYAQVGDKGDDTFGLLEVQSVADQIAKGLETTVKLPSNIPVLIDWVNNKFAYTQENGILKVQDLSRFKACDMAHARNLLVNWGLSIKTLMHIVNVATVAGVPDRLFFTEDEMASIMEDDAVIAGTLAVQPLDVKKYWEKVITFFKNIHTDRRDIQLNDISTEGFPIFRPLARYMDQVHAAVLANMEAVNTKFTVSGISSTLGVVTLIAKYANDRVNVHARANAITAAAEKQEVTPGWSPESTPLIMDNPERPFSLLPHQAKIRNLMKDSPDFAILPVQAGGGKTPLAILDILTEIKANRSKPYLVLCPSTLVAQYVKEVTYFTSGQVNVISIDSEAFRRNGFKRLTAMLASAPRNTIVVANYDALRLKAYDVCYGTTNVKVYPIIEFLRQFNFGYALMDESHYLKNNSQRTRAAMNLIADIPKKRLASGTMAHDSPSDLALQIAALDPTLFGSRSEFNERFAAPGGVKGDRVTKWRPGAEQDIMRMIKSRVVVAGAMRKEWAALLPQAIELMHPTELTPNQHKVYQAILTEVLEQIEEDAKGNAALAKFFKKDQLKLGSGDASEGNMNEDEEEDEVAEDAADESAGEDLEALLGFYLARLEQFVTAPGRDELGKAMLTGDDLRSAKVNKIIEIVQDHIAQGIEGKVLIFTNYIESAEEIFEAMPPELKKQGILYTAADKVEAGDAFEKNPNKKWMVGVEYSMNTGLNFQHVSRLIRVETVWNPGTLEQGNSRVNRPELKKADRRTNIYYDWVMAMGTIDVTKISRLISKIIAVAKFENADNLAYESIPNVPVIPMNADAIQALNNWDSLADYIEAFRIHNEVKADDYEAYRQQHGELVMTPIPKAPPPTDAALMAEVPYTPGLELYQASHKGLIRVDEYLRQDASAVEVEDEDESEAEDSKNQRMAAAIAALKGQPAHTEFGDGIIESVSLSTRRVVVSLPTGYTVRIKMAATFLITPKASRAASIREQILKAANADLPIVAPTGIVPLIAKASTKALRRHAQEQMKEEKVKREQKETKTIEARINVELFFTVSNGFLAITYYPEDDATDAAQALQALGFRPVEQHVFAEIDTQQRLLKQFDMWDKAGFKFTKEAIKMRIPDSFTDFSRVLKRGTSDATGVGYRFASRNDLQNFFRMEHKPTTSDKEFKPYPLLEDGRAFIVMPLRGQPATKRAMQVRAPGIKWQHSPDSMAYYGLDADHVSKKMREILAAGIGISNLRDLQVEFKKLKKQNFTNRKGEV